MIAVAIQTSHFRKKEEKKKWFADQWFRLLFLKDSFKLHFIFVLYDRIRERKRDDKSDSRKRRDTSETVKQVEKRGLIERSVSLISRRWDSQLADPNNVDRNNVHGDYYVSCRDPRYLTVIELLRLCLVT